jgi:hypothetical protein
MSDLPKPVGRAHRAAHRNYHGGGRTPDLWPEKDGKLHVEALDEKSPIPSIPPSPAEPKGLALPRSRRSRPKQSQPGSAGSSLRRSDQLRLLKCSDVVLFNQHSESYWVDWLADAITHAEFGCVSVGWVIQNGAFELDISIDTVKRYLVKHTADRAEFASDGKVITIRP